jgi:hypothetical protein
MVRKRRGSGDWDGRKIAYAVGGAARKRYAGAGGTRRACGTRAGCASVGVGKGAGKGIVMPVGFSGA